MESIPLLLFSRSFMSRWIWGLSVIAVSLRTGRQLVVSRIKFKFVHKSKTEKLCSSEWSRDSPPSLLMVEWIQKQTITVAGNFMGCCLCGGRTRKGNGQWYLETTTHDVHGEESGGRTETEQPVQTLIVFPVSADLKSNGMHFLRVHPRLY